MHVKQTNENRGFIFEKQKNAAHTRKPFIIHNSFSGNRQTQRVF